MKHFNVNVMNHRLKFTQFMCTFPKVTICSPNSCWMATLCLQLTGLGRSGQHIHPLLSLTRRKYSLWPAPTQPSSLSAPNGQTGPTDCLCQKYFQCALCTHTLTTIQTLTYRLYVRLCLRVHMLMDTHPAHARPFHQPADMGTSLGSVGMETVCL